MTRNHKNKIKKYLRMMASAEARMLRNGVKIIDKHGMGSYVPYQAVLDWQSAFRKVRRAEKDRIKFLKKEKK